MPSPLRRTVGAALWPWTLARTGFRRLPEPIRSPVRRVYHRVRDLRVSLPSTSSPHFAVSAFPTGRGPAARRRPFRHDEITYALFGIDPVVFYARKFARSGNPSDALSKAYHRYDIEYEKVRRLIADLQSALPEGGRVLDVGCASAPYGPTLRARLPGINLYGVDMSEECLRHARANGYDDGRVFDLTDPLPFDDASFAAVISMDLLGHIEFRHKDRLIAEMARVTRPGGLNHHGVESCYVDYFHCDPSDEADPVRRYVWTDGHVGVEAAQDVCDRFSRHFARASHCTTYLYPFMHMGVFPGLFEEEFQEVVAEYGTPEAVSLGNVILGRLNRYFNELYTAAFGPAFQPNDGLPRPVSRAQARARARLVTRIDRYNARFGIEFVPVPKSLFRPMGFTSITAFKAR
jgi:SAM-dependent methyltransferase